MAEQCTVKLQLFITEHTPKLLWKKREQHRSLRMTRSGYLFWTNNHGSPIVRTKVPIPLNTYLDVEANDDGITWDWLKSKN